MSSLLLNGLTSISMFFSNLTAQTVEQQYVYKNYTEIKNTLIQIQKNYPNNVELINLTQNDTGDMILGLKIGQGEIKNLVVGTHHGNEYGSTEVAMAFAQDLAKNPMIDQTIYVIPVLNVSGYNTRNRYEVFKAGTQTVRVDQNRDYPGPCATSGPFFSKATRALAYFIEKENITASATLHTYSSMVAYPWGISTHDLVTNHEQQFVELTNEVVKVNKYQGGNSTALLYPADGTYEDYAYWKHGVWSLLFEIGTSHNPSDSQVQKLIADNVPALRRMFEVAPKTKAVNHDFTGKCDVALKLFNFRRD